MSNTVPPAASPSPTISNSTSPAQDRPTGARAGSFRERLAPRSTGQGHDRRTTPAHDERAARVRGETRQRRNRDRETPLDSAGLIARADGLLVVTATVGPPLTTLRVSGSGSATTHVTRALGSEPTRDALAPAIADVRVGGAAGQSHVHARIMEGPHAGVEVRAVERGGRVEIELVAPSAAAETSLRAEIGAVREVLGARGLEDVSVDVRSEGRRPGDEDSRRRRQEEQASEDWTESARATRTTPARISSATEDEVIL